MMLSREGREGEVPDTISPGEVWKIVGEPIKGADSGRKADGPSVARRILWHLCGPRQNETDRVRGILVGCMLGACWGG